MRQGTPGFNGARLRQGREARGISASALADIVGVTRAAMSQYEHGRQSPSPDAMRRLSDALNLPIHFFLKPIRKQESTTAFFRCMHSATKSARLRAERRYGWLKEIVDLIQQRVRLPQIALPQFDVPRDPTKLSDSLIEELASETRRFWGLKDGPISNVVWLLENRGIVVSRFELHAAKLDAFSVRDIETGRPYVILGSDKGSAARSRFDAAHELAHLVLHREVPAGMINLNAQHPLLEKQAHRFASAFLLPANTFGDELKTANLDAFRVLKERWRVSIASMIYRAGDLKLVGDEQLKSLRINMARRKWRTVEPLDDTTEPEKPRLLRKCIELLVAKGMMPASEIPLLLGLPSRDVEQLAGLDAGYLSTADSDIELTEEPDLKPSDEMIIRFPFGNAQ